MNQILQRTHKDRMIGGVCSGLGTYLRIDPVLVRIFFILLAFGNGIGIFLYFLLWVLIPSEGVTADLNMSERVQSLTDEISEKAQDLSYRARIEVNLQERRTALMIGSALIILGTIYFVDTLEISWLSWLDFSVLWPVLLIVGGITLILRRPKGGPYA